MYVRCWNVCINYVCSLSDVHVHVRCWLFFFIENNMPILKGFVKMVIFGKIFN